MSEEKAKISIRANGSMRVEGATLIGADGAVISEQVAIHFAAVVTQKTSPFVMARIVKLALKTQAPTLQLSNGT